MLYNAYFLRNWEFSEKKNGWMGFVAKKRQNHLFQKSPNLAKSKRHRALGTNFFCIPRINFTSKTIIANWKKFHFYVLVATKRLYMTLSIRSAASFWSYFFIPNTHISPWSQVT